MQQSGWRWVAAASFVVIGGCSEAASRCTPEYPVERDGFCYAADGDAATSMDGGAAVTDAGATPDDAAPGADAATSEGDATVAIDGGPVPDGSSVICVGEHPIVEGTRRYCSPGDCFCADPDACFPADTASACCDVPVVCGDDGGTPDASAVICVGEHPLVEGTRRYCSPGDCFCADPDACFPSDTAAACCSVAVVCE